jgi:hypothetical protein
MSDLPASLIEALRNSEVIPFVGAGVSMAVTGGDGARLFPSWKLEDGSTESLAPMQKGHASSAIARKLLESRGTHRLQLTARNFDRM